MKRRPKSKSRVTAETIRVVIDSPPDRYDEPPGYSGHNNGIFQEAGYFAGKGMFGFRQDTT